MISYMIQIRTNNSFTLHLYYNSKIGGMELVEKLKSDPSLVNQPDAVAGLEEMGVLLKYCSVLGIVDMVCKYLKLVAMYGHT